MLKSWLAFLFSMVFLLTACHSPVYNQTQGNVADLKIKIADAKRKADEDAKPQPSVLVKSGSYVDTTPISLEKQPTWLKNRIVIRGDQLPFSYYSRTIASGSNSNILTKYQSGLDAAINISLNYTGTIKGALDLIAAKTGYVYNVHGNAIYWQAFITRTFDIAFMPGDSDYLMGKKGGGSGSAANTSQGGTQGTVSNYISSDSSDSEYSSLSGKISIWKDLEATVSQLLSPDGKVTVSQATTTITVRDKPTNVELISQYIKNLNNTLSKQVLVKVQVLEVDLENDFTYGLNWDIIAKAFKNSPFVINGNYGTPVSITTFTPQNVPTGTAPGTTILPTFGFQGNGNTPSYTILLNALNQQGKTSIVSEPRVVCLNNQVSVIRIVSQKGYLASVQNTSLASGSTTSIGVGTVTSQLTPGTVITGLTLYILPKILDRNIYLQINADLSTAGAFTTVSSGTGTGSTSIQVPNISEKHFNQRSMIKSGDTLILSGFRQTTNIANANQFLRSQALGGKGSQQLNTETIVLITPIILNGTA